MPSDSEETRYQQAIRKALQATAPPMPSGSEETKYQQTIRKALQATGAMVDPLTLRHICAMTKIVREDRLGRLPDDILVNILDRLNVREAVRTSVLARRWLHLPAMLSRLTVDVRDFVAKPATTCRGEEIERGNTTMVEVTKSVLARRVSCPNKIRSMCMAFFLREVDIISIGQAVECIMAFHTVDFEITVFTEMDYTRCNQDDKINYGILFRLFVDSCPIAFGGVTRLCLENLRFGESDIPNVINVCKGLKHLSLSYCNAARGTIMKVEHSQLSELLIFNCCFEKVELNSLPKLIWMIFGGWKSNDPLFLGYVPLLEAVSLSTVSLSHHKMVKLSEIFGGTSPRSLRLGFECERIWVEPESVTKKLSSVFHQLTFVNLDNIAEGCDLTWTLFILEAAPNLKELYLMVRDHLCIMRTNEEERRAFSYSEKKGVEWKSPAYDFQHHSLVTLVIFGFQSDCMVRYVRCVMQAAVNLKDVFLYHRLNCKKCQNSYTNRPLKYPSDEEEKGTVLKKLTRRIKSSATVHLPDANISADQRAKMGVLPKLRGC